MSKTNIPKLGERIELASRYIKPCKRLLDLGCGRGYLARFIKSKVLEVYGIDKSIANLILAERNGMKIEQVDLDKQKIPFGNLFFDTVVCLDVIEHIKDPYNLIKEVYRVTKRDGIFIISAPNIRFWDHLKCLVFKGKFPITSEDKSAYDGGHIHYFTFSDIKEILINAGFTITFVAGIINRFKRGIKGRILEKILGKQFMREFRSPGILIVARKP